MRKCIESLLIGDSRIEILAVDDGSQDATLSMAREYETQYPGIVYAVHQQNKGHGGAINMGLSCATELYFKVMDSDDWVDSAALQKILETIAGFEKNAQCVDLIVSNYVYDKVGVKHKKRMRYSNMFPREEVCGWDALRKAPLGKYILMHSVMYRTQLLRDCGLVLPEHILCGQSIHSLPNGSCADDLLSGCGSLPLLHRPGGSIRA